VDAIGVSAHASGWVTGPWKRKRPFLTLSELNRELFDRFRAKLVCFDACMMGTMSALYGMSNHVKITIASPGLHPYVSPFGLNAFAQSTASTVSCDQNQIRVVAKAIVAEWHHYASSLDRNRCLLAFDVDRVKAVAKLVKQHWSRLMFDKRAQLHDKDANLFDLWVAARDVPIVQSALASCVISGDEALNHLKSSRCCFACKRSRSVAVEARTPKKWQDIYTQTKWAKLMKNTHKHPPPKPTQPHHNPLVPPNLSKR
jgi:hypothetical protein